MIDSIFIFCIAIVIYIYVVYPFLIFAASIAVRRKVHKNVLNTKVSVLISAFNEEKYIEKTILNKLEQDYDGDMEIIVISDCSTDNTDAVVETLSRKYKNLVFIRQSPRQGKTSALNMAIERAAGEIIIFADANSIYQASAVRELVANFSDPEVGYVTGKMIYSNPDGAVVGDGCTAYMRYENFIRKHESTLGSIVGVDGGIDAMRKDLFQPLNPDQLPDFVQPLKVSEKGYRVIYEPDAILREETLADYNSEFAMRIRVTLRALWALFDMRQLFNPLHYPLFSFQLLSHKLLRYLAWLPLSVILFANPFLLQYGIFFWLVFVAQVLFYTGAGIGFFLRGRPDISFFFSATFYFTLINIAALIAFLKFLRKQKTVTWTPRTG